MIVAINIFIAVGVTLSRRFGMHALETTGSQWWLSSEGVWLYGGWWNVLNGLARIINVFCMTGWFGIYSSRNEQDMLWPDMT